MTRKTLATTFAALVIGSVPFGLSAQEPPRFMTETFPEQAVEGAWQEFQGVNADAALDPMTKELIGLAVAAQVPCDYCVYYHTQAAETYGATEAQIKEAVAAAALTRQWSTVLNGTNYDHQAWRDEIDAMFAGQ